MPRTRQTARKRSAGDKEDQKDQTSDATTTADTTSSSTFPLSKKRNKSTHPPPSSSSSSASLPFALPDPRSALDVDACGLNTSEEFADLIRQTLHRALAHYAATHSLPYPEPADGYGASHILNDPPSSPDQLSFFNHVPDTQLILLPDTRITAIPVPSSSPSTSRSSPATLSSLAASHSIPYRRGMGYYQLTRPEKISDTKQIIVRCDAIDHAGLMGGRAARFGPGVPPCGAKGRAVTVEPAELEDGWTVWVQSTSANRQLEAGTTALFDVDPSQEWTIG